MKNNNLLKINLKNNSQVLISTEKETMLIECLNDTIVIKPLKLTNDKKNNFFNRHCKVNLLHYKRDKNEEG